jgi:hypothetical protein
LGDDGDDGDDDEDDDDVAEAVDDGKYVNGSNLVPA